MWVMAMSTVEGEWLQSIPCSFSQLQAQTFETDRALVQDMKFGQKSLFTPRWVR